MKVRDSEAERNRDHQLGVFYCTGCALERKGARRRRKSGRSFIQRCTHCIKTLLHTGNLNKRAGLKSAAHGNWKVNEMVQVFLGLTECHNTPTCSLGNRFDISKQI